MSDLTKRAREDLKRLYLRHEDTCPTCRIHDVSLAALAVVDAAIDDQDSHEQCVICVNDWPKGSPQDHTPDCPVAKFKEVAGE